MSGYGQTGPWASRPGYASVCEAESGFRYINGFPHPETGLLRGPPVRPNISLGDSVAGLHAAFGTVSSSHHRKSACLTSYILKVLALLARQKKLDQGKSGGQTVDVSIMERYVVFVCEYRSRPLTHPGTSMLNLMEGIIPEYDRKGKVCSC